MPTFSISPAPETEASDREIENLLKEVYVAGGFTDAAVGETLFRADNVRGRGALQVAKDEDGSIFGMVITVLPGSPACKFAGASEAELHLLCVRSGRQRRGVGGALVEAAVSAARSAGATRMILWTQPLMEAARGLYIKHGFEHVPALDFSLGARTFQVFRRSI